MADPGRSRQPVSVPRVAANPKAKEKRVRIRKILIPTDFSDCARSALDRAFFLARRYAAEVHFLHVVVLHDDNPVAPISTFPESEEIHRHLATLAEAEMAKIQASVPDLETVAHVRHGLAAAPAILDLAMQEGIDLIVLGAHGRRGWRRFLLGSVAEEVVRLANCPVLTVRVADKDGTPTSTGLGPLLAPVDFSHESAIALGVAKELAAEWDVELHLLYVMEKPLSPYYEPSLLPRRDDLDRDTVKASLEKDLQRFAATTDGPQVAQLKVHVLEGKPAEIIAEFGRSLGIPVIVMATHGLRGIEAFLLGSVTEKVVRLAEGAVLVWKPRPDSLTTREEEEEAEAAGLVELPK